MTNRVLPDEPPAGMPTPQPRVYGRAAVNSGGAEPPDAGPPSQRSGPPAYRDPVGPGQPYAGRPGEPPEAAPPSGFASVPPPMFSPASPPGIAPVREPGLAPASPPGLAPASPPPVPPPAPALPPWPASTSGSVGFPPAGVSPAGRPPTAGGLGPGQPPADLPPFDAFRTNAPGSPGPAPSVGYAEPAQSPFGPPPAAPTPTTYGQPATEPEQPAPQIRNGRVLLAVLCAAVLLLVVPLGIVWLATRSSDPSFEVGSCVSRSGSEAVAADCTESDAFTVVSKVDSQDKCTDPPGQPYVVVADSGKDSVLCLRPATSK